MKQKNIVRDKNKKTPFYKNKRGVLAVILLLLMFLLTVMTMPIYNIPFIGRMGMAFGLTDDSMRALTLSDFAAYTFGLSGGGRLASVRDSQYSVYESSGGLSPFALQSSDRLLDAQKAYRAEFEKTGRYMPVAGSASGLGLDDPEGIAYGRGLNGVGPYIDPETNSAARDGYGQPFVKSFEDASLFQAYSGSSITKRDGKGNMVLSGSARAKALKPAGSSDKIVSARSDENSVYFQALDNETKRLNGGRLGAFGGINAMTSRVRTGIAPGRQLGVFGAAGRDMGRVYYLSSLARGQSYKDVVKNLVESAWDGGEVESEDLLAVGEETEKPVDSLEPPSTTIDRVSASINACSAARVAYDQALRTAGSVYANLEKMLLKAGEESGSSTGVPGSCVANWPEGSVVTKTKRQEWNAYLDAMKSQCAELRKIGESYAGQCGLTYSSTVSCSKLDEARAKGKNWAGNVWTLLTQFKQCKNNSIDTNGKSLKLDKVNSILKSVREGAGLTGELEDNFF